MFGHSQSRDVHNTEISLGATGDSLSVIYLIATSEKDVLFAVLLGRLRSRVFLEILRATCCGVNHEPVTQ